MQNEDNDKKDTDARDEEDEDVYDLEEMASQYFDDEYSTETRDNEVASTSGVNLKDNGGKTQASLSGEELTNDSAQSSGDESSEIMTEENAKNVNRMKKNKNKRKMLGCSSAKDQRARRLRKYVAEFFSSSESSSNDDSEFEKSDSSGDGNRMDGKTERQGGEESDSEVEAEGMEDVANLGQTDQNTDGQQGQKCRRTDEHDNAVKLRQTSKRKSRRRETKLGQTDDKEDGMSGSDNEEESSSYACLDSGRRFTRIRRKRTKTRLNKNVNSKDDSETEVEGSVKKRVRKSRKTRLEPCISDVDKNVRRNYRQKQSEESGGNQGSCHDNGGYLSMSADESNQSDHEEETVLPLTRSVSRGMRKRARTENRTR